MHAVDRCILGTGANSCVYDGKAITENIPSLGYILTDWGSGTVLGKDFVSLVLQEKVSKELAEDFFDTYQMGRPQILDSIYNRPLPNRFLATFCPFLPKYAEDPQCRILITNNFKKFFEYYVQGYTHDKDRPHVSFSGSVAYNFKMYLEEVAQKMGIVIDGIVQNPMDGLIKYHGAKIPML
jgi:N-acetylglucosamine kinase-like BadF-type ATPase